MYNKPIGLLRISRTLFQRTLQDEFHNLAHLNIIFYRLRALSKYTKRMLEKKRIFHSTVLKINVDTITLQYHIIFIHMAIVITMRPPIPLWYNIFIQVA